MKIKPLNEWVVIEQSEAEERTSGGIIIPEVAKEKPQWGSVVAAGPGAYKQEKDKQGKKEEKKKFIPTEVKQGDRVLYEKYMASEFELDGQKIIMVRESNILGILGSGEKNSTALQKKETTALQQKGPSALEKSKKTTAKAKAKK
ncbi:MAG: co-chaperone GroES [Nitrospirae bacterium]|nr:co-chaperone GroES [Nitrospirota bacterium]